MVSRWDALVEARTACRLATAKAAATAALGTMRAHGLDAVLFGSLADGDFRLESDVDVLVRGRVGTEDRILAERTMAACFRDTGIRYDLFFADDMSDGQARQLQQGWAFDGAV